MIQLEFKLTCYEEDESILYEIMGTECAASACCACTEPGEIIFLLCPFLPFVVL